nr:putative ribonuclease H-like domain-containing protein [Tanacetum cinerariifolium]
TKIHVDNESAICVVKNHVYHSKTKHIEIRHHFIRDSYAKRLIEMVKIHTDYNVTDLLTKAFDVNRIRAYRISSTQQMVINSPCLTNKKELAIPGETTTGKEFSNPLMAGGSPRRQETIVGTSAQTRSERVLKQPYEPPLSEGHTSGSEEGRMEHTVELTNTAPPTPYDSPLTRDEEEPSVHIEESSKHGRMIEELDKDKDVNLVSQQGEVQETTEPSKDDDDATLVETLLNIKRSITKYKGKGIIQEAELPKKIKKREMIQLSLDEELAQKLYAEELAKETARQEQEKYNLEKALELQRSLDKRERDVDKCDQAQKIDWNDPKGGYKQSYLKGMKCEDIRPIVKRVKDQVHTFVPKDSKIKKEVMKRSRFHLQKESSKKQKLDQ